jgi:hypothetical protein
MDDHCIRICGTLMYHLRFDFLLGSLSLMVLLLRIKGASEEWRQTVYVRSVEMRSKQATMLWSSARRLLRYGRR